MRLKDCYSEGLLKKVPPSIDIAKRSLEVADNTMHKAKDNLDLGHYDVTLVLSYTAMFHAARAILFRDGVKERSHVCIVIYLKSTYPKLNEIADTLDAFRTSRHATLYGLDNAMTKDDAEEAISSAKEFIKKIKDFLKDLK